MNNTDLLNHLLQLTIWKTIKDYPNYEISICGQVRNINTKKVLKQCISGDGYYFVNLCKNGKSISTKIHRIMGRHFIPKLDDKSTYIDHKNNNKLDNTISNLRWCTQQQNSFNSSLNKRNTSGSKGITWENKKWRARIEINGKKIHLGYFDDINDAKLARQKKANELYGEYTNSCEIIIIV